MCEEKDKSIYNFPLEVLKYQLSDEIINSIRNTMIEKKPVRPRWCDDMENLYFNLYKMRYIFNYTTGEMQKCFNYNKRSVEVWLKSMGWQLDKFEAQQRIVERGLRDYKQIKNKGKATRIKNSYDGTSPQENYARALLNTYLSYHLYNCEVIVGLNNVSILDNGKEIDIPIIINYKDTYYKFAVEYNGDYWHQDEDRENEKLEMVNSKGYHLFFIVPKKNATVNQIKVFTEGKVISICNEIKKVIGYNG